VERDIHKCRAYRDYPVALATTNPMTTPPTTTTRLASPITAFQGEYRWLSNFWPALVLLDDVAYPTVEHAYQAAKTVDDDERAAIRAMMRTGQAKRAGRKVTLRPDWDAVKESIMLDLLRQKFAGPLGVQLAATGDAELIESNWWGDTFWGVCGGRGENRLGKLIMQVRSEIAEQAGGCNAD
jgi:ribA/ribD-fused uncharacterized protein